MRRRGDFPLILLLYSVLALVVRMINSLQLLHTLSNAKDISLTLADLAPPLHLLGNIKQRHYFITSPPS